MRHTSTQAVVGLAAVLALGLSACTDDNDTSGGNADSGLTGEPLLLRIIAPISAGARVPQVPAAARAAAMAVNADGGVNGRPIEIDVCDTRQTNEGEAACAQDLNNSDVIALVGEEATNSSAVVDASVRNSIANIGPAGVGAADLLETSTTSFPLAVGATGVLTCPAALADQGALQIGTVAIDNGGGAQLTAGVQAVIGTLPGAAYTAGPKVGGSENNVAAPVQTLLDAGTQGAVLALAQPQAISMLGANNGRMRTCTADGVLNLADLESLGDSAGGFMVVGGVPPISLVEESGEAGAQFVEELEAYHQESDDPDAAFDQANGLSIVTWMSVHAFAQVAGELDEITPESVTEAFSQTTDLAFPGLLPEPIDFTQTKPVPNLARLFNASYGAYAWDVAAADFVSTGERYDVIEILTGQS